MTRTSPASTTGLEQRSARARRSARNMLFSYTAIALLMAWLPPLIPPSIPVLHGLVWYAIAALAGGLTVLLTVRPATRRSLVLSLGWLQLILTVLQAFLIGDLIAMFCTWLVVPALALLAGQLRARPRKALVAAHVISSASWVGIGLVILAMSVVAMTSSDIHTTQVIYELMAVFDLTLLPWANFAASLTGIALGITTKWGLIRYYWVAIKLAIAVGVLVMAFAFLHGALVSAAEQAAHLAVTGGTAAELTDVSDVVFWGFAISLLSLVGAMLLSLYKPGGKTRRGRRLAGARRVARHA